MRDPAEIDAAPRAALERLAQLRRAADAATDVAELGQLVAAQVTGLVGAPAVCVSVVENGALHLVASHGFSAAVVAQFPAPVDDAGPLGEAASTREPVTLLGAANIAECSTRWRAAGVQALAVVPVVHRGRAVGAIAAGRFEEEEFAPTHVQLLELVAGAVSDALDRLPAVELTAAHSAAMDRARELSFVPSLLRTISDGLGSDMVMLVGVDRAAATTTPLAIHDPHPDGAERVPRLEGVPQRSAGGESTEALLSGTPVFEPHLESPLEPVPGCDAPWVEYLAELPVRALMRVPIVVDGDVVALLETHRRGPVPYTPADLDYVQASAQRIAGAWAQLRVLERTPAPATAKPERLAPHDLDLLAPPRPGVLALDLLAGLGVPFAIAVANNALAPVIQVRPAATLLAGVTLVAVWRGWRASVIATTAASVALWWAFTEPELSFAITARQAGGLALFVASAILVLTLAARSGRAVQRWQFESRLLAAIMEEAPIGLAFLDRDLRFRRVNRHLEVINGMPAEQQQGKRPSEIAPMARDLYEHLLADVVRTGRPIVNRDLTVEVPEAGIERHWRASYVPIEVEGSRVGVAAAVLETTGEVIARRRAERLLTLATLLSEVTTQEAFAEVLAGFLRDTYTAHAAVGFVDGDDLRVAALAGYGGAFRERWHGQRVPLAARSPMTDAGREGRSVEIGSLDEFPPAYATSEPDRELAGDIAVLAAPLHDVADAGEVVAVMHLGWTAPHVLSEHGRVLFDTVTAMAETAFARLRLREQVEQDRFRAAIDAMQDDVLIACSVRDDGGRIVDFAVDYANHSRDQLIGRRLGEAMPGIEHTDLFGHYVEVVETGVPYIAERLREPAEDRYRNVRVTKFGDGFVNAVRDVTEAVKAERIAEENRRLADRERSAVELLQRAALPLELPSVAGVRMAAMYQPAVADQPIGGDWYDVFPLDDDRLALLIADVAGHGQEAASFMVQVRNVVRALSLEHREPRVVLERSNRVARPLTPEKGLFVTCCYATLDLRTRELSWARAGHFEPLLVRGGRAAFPGATGGPPLAVFPRPRFPDHAVRLDAGDRIVLFTDGLVERRGESIDEGLARLGRAAERTAALEPQACVDELVRGVRDQFDDLAVVCVQL